MYLPVAFSSDFPELLEKLRMNYWRRNHSWIFREQNWKRFLGEWITSRKDNYGILGFRTPHRWRGQGSKASPSLFFENREERTLILGKNTLIVSIYGLNVSFEMQFYEDLGEKMFVDKVFIEVPSIQEILPALKNSSLHAYFLSVRLLRVNDPGC